MKIENKNFIKLFGIDSNKKVKCVKPDFCSYVLQTQSGSVNFKKFLFRRNYQMIEIQLKNKLIELFPEAEGFITGIVNEPVVVSCRINKQKISSDQINEIKELLELYKYTLIFKLDKNFNMIRININFEYLYAEEN